MTLNDTIIKTYLQTNDYTKLQDEWYFTKSQLAVQENRNIFTIPIVDNNTKVHLLSIYKMVQKEVNDFLPVNESVLRELFPQFERVLEEIQIHLIMGLPECHDSVVQTNLDGKEIILLDLVNLVKYIGYCDMGITVKKILTHEVCHILIHDMFPEIKEMEMDYKIQFDKRTFDEAFAHLLSFQGTEISVIRWKEQLLLKIRAQCKKSMKKALEETEDNKQKILLAKAFSGMYYDKFASMCGMLFLAEVWEKGGVESLKNILNHGWIGFAEMCIS